MPKLTYKAIARMSGYRVQEEYRGKMPYMEMVWQYRWYAIGEDGGLVGHWLATEQDAWEDCCKVCGLVEDV